MQFPITTDQIALASEKCNIHSHFIQQIPQLFQDYSHNMGRGSPGWMHETSARGWCTGMTQRDEMVREVGGGLRMGNTCKSMADSCQCMEKTTTIL